MRMESEYYAEQLIDCKSPEEAVVILDAAEDDGADTPEVIRLYKKVFADHNKAISKIR